MLLYFSNDRHGRRCRSAKGIIVRHSDDGQDRKSLASRVEPPRLFFVFDFDLHFSFLVQELVLHLETLYIFS